MSLSPSTQKLNRVDKKLIEVTENPFFKVAVFSIASLTALGSVVISSSLPKLTEHFEHVQNIKLLSQLVLVIPSLIVVFISPLAGFLMDKYGRLRFILPSIILWAISGSIGFFLNDVYNILISRAIFGIATAFAMVGSSALLGDYYSRGGNGRREKALSLQGFFTAFGGGIFVSIGGLLSSYSWRYPFLVYSLGFLIFIYAYFMLFEPKRSKSVSYKTNIKTRFNYYKILPVCSMNFFIMFSYYFSPTQLPFYMEHTLGLDAKFVGLAMSASAFSYGIFALLYNRLRQRLNITKIYTVTLLIVATSFIILYFFHNLLGIIIALILLGCGGGIMLVNGYSWVFSIVPANMRAKVYGIVASCTFLGQFFSPLISTPLVNIVGISLSFFILACIMMCLSIIFFIVKPVRIDY